MPSGFIFPTSVYGSIGGIYGTAITAYNTVPNTTGFPLNSGLALGTAGLLFDFTECKLFNCSGTVAQYAAVTYTQSATAPYTNVGTTTTANTVPIIAISDRAGSTSLAQNNIAWMTTRGAATALVKTTITAPAFLVSSTTAGTLGLDVFKLWQYLEAMYVQQGPAYYASYDRTKINYVFFKPINVWNI